MVMEMEMGGRRRRRQLIEFLLKQNFLQKIEFDLRRIEVFGDRPINMFRVCTTMHVGREEFFFNFPITHLD